MHRTSDHSRTPPEPGARPAEEPDEGDERDRDDRDRDDNDATPDHPLDEPAPVPLEDPPPPVTPGPYVAQEEKL